MSAQPWSHLDDETGNLLDLLNADWRPFAEEDRNIIARAIRDDARENGGAIDPNRVRKALVGHVKPQRVGPMYRALRLLGHIEIAGTDINDGTAVEQTGDRKGSGNGGRLMTTYRWIGADQ